jgi:hypothetical protein
LSVEVLDLGELHALALIGDGLPIGPAGHRNAPAEAEELLFRNIDAERTDRVTFGRAGRMCRKQAGAPATATLTAAVPGVRRRSRLMSSEVSIVRIGEYPRLDG